MTQELKDTVIANDHINEVHFDAKGNHYFNVHEHSGAKFGQIIEDVKMKNGTVTKTKVPNLNTKIVKTINKEDILKTEPKK